MSKKFTNDDPLSVSKLEKLNMFEVLNGVNTFNNFLNGSILKQTENDIVNINEEQIDIVTKLALATHQEVLDTISEINKDNFKKQIELVEDAFVFDDSAYLESVVLNVANFRANEPVSFKIKTASLSRDSFNNVVLETNEAKDIFPFFYKGQYSERIEKTKPVSLFSCGNASQVIIYNAKGEAIEANFSLRNNKIVFNPNQMVSSHYIVKYDPLPETLKVEINKLVKKVWIETSVPVNKKKYLVLNTIIL